MKDTTIKDLDFTKVETKTTVAIIIAIENYRYKENGISQVLYAQNDATKFKKLLKDDFGVAEENITMWLDNDAVKSALENDLRYQISQLTKDDRLIFYYAGHGFYQGNDNRLTCWDTHPTNLTGTTVSMDEVLFKPLEESGCVQSLVFLDCCAVQLAVDITSRDLIANMSQQKLEKFIRPEKYNALFMSCSPGEKSYPSKTLMHGIWTWHLLEALKGNMPEAIAKGRYITDSSLRNYLSSSVPNFITHQTTHKDTQRPFAKIDASNDFLIRELPAETEANADKPDIHVDTSSVIFRKVQVTATRNGSGFKKNHFVPTVYNASSNLFTQNVFEEELQKDLQTVYIRAKNVFSLRSKAISIEAEGGAGSVDCPVFRYSLGIEQSQDNPSQAVITRTLAIRVRRSELTANFDSIFPVSVNEVILPIKSSTPFQDLVEQFENLEEVEGGRLEEYPLDNLIDYTTSNGVLISIDIVEQGMVITPSKTMKFLQFIDAANDGLSKVASKATNLISQ